MKVWIGKGFFEIYCHPVNFKNLSEHFMYKFFPFNFNCPGSNLFSSSSKKTLSKNTIIYLSPNLTLGDIRARLQLYTY